MSYNKKFIFVLIVLLVQDIYFSYGQGTAAKKCRDYLKIPGSFNKMGLGIIGGSLSHSNEFPHMAALGYGSKRSTKWLCGGTIISENYVLTAAHCTNHQEYGPVKMARLGIKNLKDNNNAVDISVSRIVVHPKYKPPLQYNDIALLKLKNAIHFTKAILPACLNTAFDVRPRTNKLTAAGWGLLSFGGISSDDLMKVELSMYTHRQCRATYQNTSKRKLSKEIDDSTQICAGRKGTEEKDTCQGDSGGPLAMKTGALYSVVGVTSFGKACEISETPGVYTRVSAYVPWIEKTIWPK